MATQASFEDSNIALIGTSENIALRLQAARTEEQWQHAGETDLQVWRIEQFKVVPIPKNEYGVFFNGDSYIVLKTVKGKDDTSYDIHFWIGQHSTQDEYGTAAYKAAELDDFFNQKPIIHREVEGNESSRFKSYFKQIFIREGGVSTGFRKVVPDKQNPVLYHIKGKKKLVVTQVPELHTSHLNHGDAFVLDLGSQIYIWKGSNASPNEKFKAAQVVSSLKDERGKATVFDVSEDSSYESEFFECLKGTQGDIQPAIPDVDKASHHVLYRLSDADGLLSIKKVEENVVHRSSFNSNDVFIVDLGSQVFIWIGKHASLNEKKNAIHYGHSYLVHSGTNPNRSIERVSEGVEPDYMIRELK